jgi:transposase
MSQTRKQYTREFKLEALQLAQTSGRPKAQIERELGLPKGSLHRWATQLRHQGREAFPGHGRLTETEERLRRLERENTILRQERDILKKAIAVFSPRGQ